MSNVTAVDERELERLAAEELLREACRGKIRAEAQGPQGWLKCPLPRTNKNFLRTTLKNAIASNNFKQRVSNKRAASPEKSAKKSDSDKSERKKQRR